MSGRSAGSIALTAAFVSAVACGGGSEVAPSNPVVGGSGTASATLGGVSLGETRHVVSGVASSTPRSVAVVGESVTFTAGVATLAHRPLSGTVPVMATGVGGAPSYSEGTAFTANRAAGTLTLIPGGPLPDGSTVLVDYSYDQFLLSVDVGITFAAGEYIRLEIYNIERGTTGPLTLTASASSRPTNGSPAFNVVQVETVQTALPGRGNYAMVPQCSTSTDPVDCPVANQLVLDSVNFTNELNLCVSGTLHATLTDNNNTTDPLNRAGFDLAFDDPDC